jgi:hypothetical protein
MKDQVTALLHVLKSKSVRQQKRHHVALGLLKAALEKHAKFVQDKIDRHPPSFQQASNYVSYEEACRKPGELNKAGNL